MNLQELLAPLSLNPREMALVQEQLSGINQVGQVETMLKDLQTSDTMKASNPHHRAATGLNVALNALRSELSSNDTPGDVITTDGSVFDPNLDTDEILKQARANQVIAFGEESVLKTEKRQSDSRNAGQAAHDAAVSEWTPDDAA